LGKPAIFLQHRPVFGLDQLDALAAELFGNLAGFLNAPVLFKTPVCYGLFYASFGGLHFDTSGFAGTRRQSKGHGRCRAHAGIPKNASAAEAIGPLGIRYICLVHSGFLSVLSKSVRFMLLKGERNLENVSLFAALTK
jgi:hypothetical protein